MDIPQLALDWHKAGAAVAIATVVRTWGSAPRPVGSQMVIDADGAMEGSVSGGCVEAAVVTGAQDAITSGRPLLLHFGVSDDDAFAVGLACGGEIDVLVEPVGPALPVALLEDLVAARAAQRAVVCVTDLQDFTHRLMPASAFPDRVRLDRSGVEPDGRTFVAVHNPPLRMIVIGAVHIAQALVPMAQACGFAPVVVDPRGAFATPARFPQVTLVDDWPDAAMEALAPDARTAVVALTHDPKLDDPAILAALQSPCFYIGALGSTRSHAKRLDRLAAAGAAHAQLGRIHGPVGLDIGGRAPAEIAVSIMAEVIATLRKPGG